MLHHRLFHHRKNKNILCKAKSARPPLFLVRALRVARGAPTRQDQHGLHGPTDQRRRSSPGENKIVERCGLIWVHVLPAYCGTIGI